MGKIENISKIHTKICQRSFSEIFDESKLLCFKLKPGIKFQNYSNINLSKSICSEALKFHPNPTPKKCILPCPLSLIHLSAQV